MQKKWISLLAACALLIGLFTVPASAASTSISFSSSSVTVGSTVTVTATFSGGDQTLGAVDAYLTYDPGVLQFVSGNSASGGAGSVSIVGFGDGSAKTLSYAITFKAIGAGSSAISLGVNQLLSFGDGEGGEAVLPASGSSATLTVVSNTGGGGGSGGGGGQSTRPSQSEAEPEPEEPVAEVTVSGESRYLWPTLDGVEIPDGFERFPYEYKGHEFEAVRGTSQNLILFHMTNAEHADGRFYVYIPDEDVLYPYTGLSLGAAQYTVLRLPEGVTVPAGFKETELNIAGEQVPAWVLESGDHTEFYLLYAMNSEGASGFYMFDTQEETMQRYIEIAAPVIAPPEPEEPEPEEPQGNVYERITSDDEVLMVVAILTAAFLGLLLTNIVVLLVRQLAKTGPRRREKSQEKLVKKNGDALVQQSEIVVAAPDAAPEELKAETAELPPLSADGGEPQPEQPSAAAQAPDDQATDPAAAQAPDDQAADPAAVQTPDDQAAAPDAATGDSAPDAPASDAAQN